MKKVAFLFPGQGAQYVGMGKALYETFPSVRSIFDQADAILGRSLTNIIFHGPEDLLRQTENTQPAIFTMSCALFNAVFEKGLKPAAVAGHSLGEYSALYAAGVFTFEQGLTLVERRGTLIRECSHAHPGTMCAILGLNPDQLDTLLNRCSSSPPVELVNFNCDGQVVCAGSYEAIKEAQNLAQELGALKVIPLRVSGPFHSSAMHQAAVEMKEALHAGELSNPLIPVISNYDAQKTLTKGDVINKLSAQIDHPVLWEKSIQAMISMGIDAFVEIGPGKVLTGLNRRINRKINSYNIEDIQSFDKVINILKENTAGCRC